MKFGKQLRYECVSEWQNKYISYGKLKKYLRYLFQSKLKNIEGYDLTHLKLNGNIIDSSHSINQKKEESQDPSFTRIDIDSEQQQPPPNNNNNNEKTPLLNNSNETDYLKASIEKKQLFFMKLNEELQKINSFFGLKEKDIILHYNKLTEHCSMILKDRNPSPKVLKSIQKAFHELYKGLTMLENYVTLNYMGFQKILKKYDRISNSSDKEDQMNRISQEKFYQSKHWKMMKEDVELLYCKVFKLDKIALAKKKLEPFTQSHSQDYHMLKLGFAIGISIATLAFIVVLFISGAVVLDPNWDKFVSVVPIFRGVAIPIIAVWLWGVNVWIWEKARVNYILIFGLDPRTTIDHRRIFKTASFLTSIWLGTFLLFCGTIMGNFTFAHIPAEVYPLMLVVFFLIVVFFPFRFFHRKSRAVLFVTLGNVLMTPFGSTKFRALYLGDVLTSMVKTIFDWEYTACYFITGDWMRNDGGRCNSVNQIALPIISGLPLLWRLMQCILRYRETSNKIHLGNATKYGVGFSVVLFSALNGNYLSYPEPWTASRILWCICFVLATLYMYVWDVIVDFGLIWLGSPRPLLRHSLMYKKHIWSYYYVIFSNFILRFAWTLTVTPIEINVGINNELFVTIFATVELFRRFTWSIYRVENEHICNSLQYHAFDFSDAPWKDEIKSKDLSQIGDQLENYNPISPLNNNNIFSSSNSNNNNNNTTAPSNQNSGAISTGSGSGVISNSSSSGSSNNNNNSSGNYGTHSYSTWKKSSKQYYSVSLIDRLKNFKKK